MPLTKQKIKSSPSEDADFKNAHEVLSLVLSGDSSDGDSCESDVPKKLEMF